MSPFAPPSFWEAAPLLDLHLIVLRDLPAHRDTLLLRLQGTDKTYLRAVHELDALPRDAWEAALAMPLLLAFRLRISHTTREDAMNLANDELQAIYDDWERRVLQPAWEAGRLQTLRNNLSLMYQARFGGLPPEVKTAIEATEDADTLQQWVVPFAIATPEELAALVRGR